MLRAALPPRSIQNNICHSARSECNERSRGTHSLPPHSTADAVPPGNISSVTSQKQFAEPTELQVDTAIRDYAQNNGSASTEDIGVTSGYCDYAVLPHSFAQHDIKKSTTQHGRSMTCEKSTAQHDNIYNATQALDKLEQKLDQRLRVAATNFTNNAAQSFVQQSLPQRLLGGHWLTEKFQFLSTLAWQSGDDEGGILGELDLVVPLYGMRNAAGVDQYGFFLQPGLVSWEADNGYRRLDVNVGLVYRQRIRERIAVGASVFYDHNIDSDLKRIGAGADIVSRYTYLSLNYYEPLDGWRTGERLGYEERALRGVDINIEQALLDTDWVVEASGGYWKGYDSDNRQGEWQLAGSVGVRYYPLDYLSVYADYAYHHEDVDTDRFAAGIEFSYPGKHRGVSENEIDLWRPVTREKRILYAERKKIVTPILTLATNPANTAGGDAISLRITSDRAIPGTLTLSFTFSGQVTASDFMNGQLTQSVDANFNGGTTATVQIPTVADTDAVESYTITLESSSNYRVGQSVQVMGRITPSPGRGTPTLTLATNPADVAGGGTISLVVSSDVALSSTLTLPLTISGQVAASDFTNGLMQSVDANFNGGTAATVAIATVKDADAVESYTITLGSGSGYLVGGDNTATGRITMALPILTLATDPAAVVAGNNILLVITSDDAVAGTLTLPLTISDRASTGIVAGDFTGGLTQSVSANFGGTTSATVMIATEKFAGTAKTYTITLGGGMGYMAGSDNTAAGAINAAMPTLTLATDPSAVVAGNAISLVITSDISVAGSLTLALMISDRASSGIVAGDFTGGLTQSVSANFGGSTSATVTIATTRFGGTAKTYTITLGSGAGYIVGGDNTATGTINAATPTLSLMTAPTAVTAGGNISLVVTSDIPIAGSLTVAFLILEASGITAGDFTTSLTSLAGIFLGGSESINFNGGRTATITIGTARDGDTAPETYRITLRNSVDRSYLVGSQGSINGVINEI